jgi:hypothetical protein
MMPPPGRTLFTEIRENSRRQYNIKVSCLEIYEEKMYDLLNERKQVMMRSFEDRGRRILRWMCQHSHTPYKAISPDSAPLLPGSKASTRFDVRRRKTFSSS